MHLAAPKLGLLRMLGFAVLTAGYVGVGVFDHELWPPTEQAVAGAAWEMYSAGDWLVPRVNGMPYLEKPPLAYALSAAAFAVAGRPSAGLLRLPDALAGVGCVLLVFLAARRLYGEPVAWGCALVCALTANFWSITHRASSDALAMLFIFLCLTLFLRSLPERAGAPPVWRWRADLPFCIALALSFFVKNFYPSLLVLPPVAVTLLVLRDHRRLLGICVLFAAALMVLVVPWAWALDAQGGMKFLRVVFFDNTVGRFTDWGPPAGVVLGPLNDAFDVGKQTSPAVVLTASPAQMVPWILIEPVMLWAFFRNRSGEPWRLFLKIALASMLIALTLSASRAESYYRPIVFVLALMTGEYLAAAYAAVDSVAARRARTLIVANLVLVAVAFACVPLAAALYLDSPQLGWVSAALGALVLAALVLRRRRWQRPATAFVLGGVAAAVTALGFAVAIPRLDAARSWQPFFAAIAPRLQGHDQLWTTAIDDRRLPAINYYLDKRVTLLADPDAVPAMLRAEANVAVIVESEQYDRLSAALVSVPHHEQRAPSGPDIYVLLDNFDSVRSCGMSRPCADVPQRGQVSERRRRERGRFR